MKSLKGWILGVALLGLLFLYIGLGYLGDKAYICEKFN